MQSVDGDISVGGEGGYVGVRINWGSAIVSTGTGADAATIMVQGTGSDYGVVLNHNKQIAPGAIRSVDGDITVLGWAVAPSGTAPERGILVADRIEASGDANITLAGWSPGNRESAIVFEATDVTSPFNDQIGVAAA